MGKVWMDSLPTDVVHSVALGDENVHIFIKVPFQRDVPLPVPTFDSSTVGDALRGFVAWPRYLVELGSLSKVSKAPCRKEPTEDPPEPLRKKVGKPRKLKKTLATIGEVTQPLPNPLQEFPTEIQDLMIHAWHKIGTISINFPSDITQVKDKQIYITIDDIELMAAFQELSIGCIMAYMW